MTKWRMLQILQTLYGNIIDRTELCIYKQEFAWHLNVDILVLDELALHQIDQISLAIRSAFQDLALPQVIATVNSNTNQIEVGLVEEVYPDKDNTDQLVMLKSAQNAPFVVTVGLLRDEVDGDLIVLDCDETEVQCVDQLLHIAVDQACRVYAFEQSRGQTRKQPCAMPANIFTVKNLSNVLKAKVKELAELQ